jgi:hypothetical protein
MGVEVQKIERDGYTAEVSQHPRLGRVIRVTGPRLSEPMEWIANGSESDVTQMRSALVRAIATATAFGKEPGK